MGWYVVETNPCAEYIVQKKIKAIEPVGDRPPFTTWLLEIPRIAPPHYRFASPTILVIRGYVFVQFDPIADDGAWQDMNRIEGVKSVIGQAGRRGTPALVRPKDFQRLQELAVELQADQMVSIEEPKPLKKHTLVRVLWGTMPVIGKIDFDNGVRADVLLQTAGVASKISLPRELIEAL